MGLALAVYSFRCPPHAPPHVGRSGEWAMIVARPFNPGRGTTRQSGFRSDADQIQMAEYAHQETMCSMPISEFRRAERRRG
jgi:hypothetical protein